MSEQPTYSAERIQRAGLLGVVLEAAIFRLGDELRHAERDLNGRKKELEERRRSYESLLAVVVDQESHIAHLRRQLDAAKAQRTEERVIAMTGAEDDDAG